MTRISPAKWAHSRGFSRQYAHQLIKQGIVPALNGKVDPQEANQALAAHQERHRVHLKGQSRDVQRFGHDHSKLQTLLLICRIKNLEERNKLLSIKRLKQESLGGSRKGESGSL